MSVTVGFSPVTPGNSMVATGVAAGAGQMAEGETPLGFVDALLAMLTQSLGTGTEPQTGGEAGTGTAPAPQVANLADVGLAVDTAIKTDLPVTKEQVKDGKALLGDLVTALAAMDDAADNGQAVDPALEKKLNETIEAIAGMLGITMPTAPVTTLPTALAGQQVTADVAIDAGTTPLPPGYQLPEAGDKTKPDTTLADDFLKAVEAAKTPVIEDQPETDETGKVKPKADGETVDPETPIGKLITKLAELADKLEGKLPDIAAKLDALAQKLASQTVDPKMLAKVEAGLDGIDLDALLGPKPDATKSAAPSPFTAPALPTPEVVTAPKQTAEAPKTEPLAAAKEPVIAKPEEKPVAKDTKPERADTDNKPRDRGFAAHLAETRAEKLADQQQNQSAQVAAQVKTDMGVVAPKAVHAAYQAPVQQINMPQVAFEVVRQFSQGASRFQIRLDPPELGRIDVRMQVDGDGNVHARMTVERAETLDLMQRDQRSLEKALAQAGLDSSKTSLEFSLRQNPFARDGQSQQQQQNGHNPFLNRSSGTEEVAEIATTTTQYRGLASASGVNLFV